MKKPKSSQKVSTDTKTIRSNDKPNAVIAYPGIYLVKIGQYALELTKIDEKPDHPNFLWIAGPAGPYLVHGTCIEDITVEIIK